MRVFLSGPMGSGKSTLGPAVAERLGVPWLDLDEVVAQRAGVSVTALFDRIGEAGFRAQEAEALSAVLATGGPLVLSLGGGTVTQPELRAKLLAEGVLLSLTAAPEVLSARVGAGAGRPLLAGDAPAARLARLLEERAAAYAECHGVLRTDRASVSDLAARVASLCRDPPIVVPLGLRSYRVSIGSDMSDVAADQLAAASAVIVVTDEHVAPLWLAPVQAALAARSIRHRAVVLPAGEAHKNIRSVECIWNAALQLGIDRRAWVLGIGGGVVGDMAGFAAATLLRGIAVGHMPTTLLSMVDSAVGGKTGFDTAEGKNLIGAFHQPGFVLADVQCLSTLPDAELIAGLAEVAKSAWIEGEPAVAQLEADAEALLSRDQAALRRAIHMSCRMKARVVTADEREAGLRAVLNLGHTVGHAIEAAQAYAGLRHGEAIALGMVAATRLARRRGDQSSADGQRLVRLLSALRLPTNVDDYIDDHCLSFIGADKKRDGERLGFVVPGAPGEVSIVRMPLEDVLSGVRA